MGLERKTKIKVDLYFDTLKDVRNTAVKTYKQATNPITEQFGKAMIQTLDVLIAAYCQTFDLPKPEAIITQEEPLNG